MSLLLLLTIFSIWATYHFFTKWLWWLIGFAIVVTLVAWFIRYGWLLIMLGSFTLAIYLFYIAYKQHQLNHK
ncbi:hypothetical protein C5Z26_11585 [Lactobacillus sp. CBA3606]|uniref:hypothetical protein n=1 Tax=Lactobacillus sp. CBA3606 TaxID=2099789 RepID=UPI000CFBCA31|nr:hypothetical protein [Lactobacillus sp. CBA3606]AVK64704.1 hypothetical protein C5Z26_11585 [Lactobacillus sp. CBA3606]